MVHIDFARRSILVHLVVAGSDDGETRAVFEAWHRHAPGQPTPIGELSGEEGRPVGGAFRVGFDADADAFLPHVDDEDRTVPPTWRPRTPDEYTGGRVSGMAVEVEVRAPLPGAEGVELFFGADGVAIVVDARRERLPANRAAVELLAERLRVQGLDLTTMPRVVCVAHADAAGALSFDELRAALGLENVAALAAPPSRDAAREGFGLLSVLVLHKLDKAYCSCAFDPERARVPDLVIHGSLGRPLAPVSPSDGCCE